MAGRRHDDEARGASGGDNQRGHLVALPENKVRAHGLEPGQQVCEDAEEDARVLVVLVLHGVAPGAVVVRAVQHGAQQ